MLEQLLVHGFGDFYTQSDWMALNKSKRTIPCLTHVILYTACFFLLTFSWKALLIIGATHFLIDRFHTPLKRLIWWKNHIGPTWDYPQFEYCNTTGYYDDSPYNALKPSAETLAKYGTPRHFFITAWLYIICDNLLHLTINYLALKYFV
jgi:hypothetical protein